MKNNKALDPGEHRYIKQCFKVSSLLYPAQDKNEEQLYITRLVDKELTQKRILACTSNTVSVLCCTRRHSILLASYEYGNSDLT